MARSKAQIKADPGSQEPTERDSVDENLVAEGDGTEGVDQVDNEPTAGDDAAPDNQPAREENLGQPDLNTAEINELEVNEHNTVTGTAPVGHSLGGPDAVEDVDHDLYAATRSANSTQITARYVKKYTIRRVDWEGVQADEEYEQAQHNANVTATRNSALHSGLMPLGDGGEFTGTEDLDEDTIALVYQVEVVPNNDDADRIYVNPVDHRKGEDLTEPGWQPPVAADPTEQQFNDPDATWSQPEPVHITDILAEKDSDNG
jgi:hypothetical protein